MARAAKNLLVLLASTALAVACAECGLRWYYTRTLRGFSGEHSLRVPHPVRGWTLRADATAFQRTRDYGVTVRTNDRGLRDRPHALRAAPGTFRIVVLGDSFMEAYQVRLEESLPFLLQEELAERGVEVINLGVGGYGTAQQLLYLRDEGFAYRPDLVVLAFYSANDVLDNSRGLQERLVGADDIKTWSRPYAELEADGGLRWIAVDPARLEAAIAEAEARRRNFRPRLVRLLQPAMVASVIERGTGSILQRFASESEHDPNLALGWPLQADFAPEYARDGLTRAQWLELWTAAWRATQEILREANRQSRARGARLVVLFVPARLRVEAALQARIAEQYPHLPLDLARIERELAALCAAEGIPFLNLGPILAEAQARGEGPFYYQVEDFHWNATGHRRAASELAAFLDARGLLP